MASIHDLCNPEAEEKAADSSLQHRHPPSAVNDHPQGSHPYPHSHPHPHSNPSSIPPTYHPSHHHYPKHYPGEYQDHPSHHHHPPPPPQSHPSSHHRSHRTSHSYDRHLPPHYSPYPPPPHHPQPYPRGSATLQHHQPPLHHQYHDMPPPHHLQYDGRHVYDPLLYPPSRRSHSPPPSTHHPAMNGQPRVYDHYTSSPPHPQHPRSQRPHHYHESQRDHPGDQSRDRSKDHSREPYPTNQPPVSTLRVVAPAPAPVSAPSSTPSVSAPAPTSASAPQAESRTTKTEKDKPRRNIALIDERPARIKIAQQPLHARMCGFGEKDRRPIDPPPIVQLLLDEDHEQHPSKRLQRSAAAATKKAAATSAKLKENSNGEKDINKDNSEIDELEDTGSPLLGKRRHPSNSNGSNPKDKANLDEDELSDSNSGESDNEDNDPDDGQLQEQDPLFVLHVSLWSADGKEVRNMIATPGQSEPPKLTRILMGSLVVSPVLLNNPEGVPGWYFSFPDLSIRTEGVYTLKFSLMRFGSYDFTNNDDGHASMLVAEEISEPFTVFSAKKFPGMTESTELSKAFAKQGLKIPIRNDLRIRKVDRD